MSFPLLSFLFIGFSLSFSLSFVCGCLAFGLRLSVLSVLPSSLSRVWLPFGDQTFSEYLHYSVQGLFFSPFGSLGLFRPRQISVTLTLLSESGFERVFILVFVSSVP